MGLPVVPEHNTPPLPALHWPTQIPALAPHLLLQMPIVTSSPPPQIPPPPANREPAAPNCATEFMGERAGWGGRESNRSSGMTKASGAAPRTAAGRGARRSSLQAWRWVTLSSRPTRSGPTLLPPTALAFPCPCLCCSWWLRVRFGSASRTVIFFVLFLFVVTSVPRDDSSS